MATFEPVTAVITALVFMSSITTVKGQCGSDTCEPIAIEGCQQGLSYSQTGNTFNQLVSNTPALGLLVAAIPGIVAANCYADSLQFICGALVPECTANGYIHPTKAMCGAFIEGCRSVVEAIPNGAGIGILVLLDDCASFADAPNNAECPGDGVPSNAPPATEVLPTMGDSNMTCQVQCEEIPAYITECGPQRTTGFPNIFGHTSATEAAEEFLLYIDMLENMRCYAESTYLLLCGALFPECRANEGLVYPSRSQCQAFFDGCGDVYVANGGPDLDCNILSVSPGPVCIAQPTTTMQPTTQEVQATTMEDEENCPDGMATCAGFSINDSSYRVMLLLIIPCVAIAMQELDR